MGERIRGEELRTAELVIIKIQIPSKPRQHA